MKKFIIYIITFFCIVILIQSVLTKQRKKVENKEDIDVKANENKEEISKICND